MWSSLSEKATKGLTEAYEKTSQALNEAEKQATKNLSNASKNLSNAFEKTGLTSQSSVNPDLEKAEEGDDNTAPTRHQIPNIDQEKVLKNLQMGWSNVVETTKRTVEATREAVDSAKEVVDTERARLEENFSLGTRGFYKRDLKLSLDSEALRDADVVYITDRILSMGHPAMASNANPMITPERKLAAVAHLLNKRHGGRFLVWNLSEVAYDNSILDDQVLTFSFPGSPSPPLGLLLKILISMENWMKADKRNVAVVHCLTGKGRTSTVLAAFLSWMGEAGFGNMNDALTYIARCKQITPEELTIPSQRRYASYFKNILDGVRPSQPPLKLKRIILSEAPKFARGPAREGLEVEGKNVEEQIMGCAPYLQIFKAGKLVFTTAASLSPNQPDEDLPFVQVCDGTVPFNIGEVMQGDILIRCRHLTAKNQRVSMFRAAFHTGYVPPNVLRLTKSQLDGACADRRYADDFFVDLIFEKVDVETATKHLEDQGEEEEESNEDGKTGDEIKKGKGPIIKASSVDTMLQGDSRFWDVIAERRKEQVKQKSDSTRGPTVGRRRGENQKKGQGDDGNGKESPTKQQKAQIESFSIGNEFDFLPVESTPPTESVNEESKKDSLMEALNALDEDEQNDFPNEEATAKTETVDSGATTSATKPLFDTNAAPGKAEEKAGDMGDISQKEDNSPQIQVAEENPTTLGLDDDMDDMDALLTSLDESLLEDNIDLDIDLDDDDDLNDLENMLMS